MIRLVVIGATGQVGQALISAVRGSHRTTFCLEAFSRHEVDLSSEQSLADFSERLQRLKPDVVINAAAFTDVEGAQHRPQQAFAVNAEAVRRLAQMCRQHNALFVHYSSDYVFDDAQKTPHCESECPHPLNVYGETKLAGDEAIMATCERYLIFRAGWICSNTSRNFLKTIVTHAAAARALRVIDDQFGTPTSAHFLASITLKAITLALKKTLPFGLYHVAPEGYCSWFDFARWALLQAREAGLRSVDPENITAIASSQWPSCVTRAANSRLSCEKLKHALPEPLPSWQEAMRPIVDEMVAELTRR